MPHSYKIARRPDLQAKPPKTMCACRPLLRNVASSILEGCRHYSTTGYTGVSSCMGARPGKGGGPGAVVTKAAGSDVLSMPTAVRCHARVDDYDHPTILAPWYLAFDYGTARVSPCSPPYGLVVRALPPSDGLSDLCSPPETSTRADSGAAGT